MKVDRSTISKYLEPKLLRALESGVIERVGGSGPIQVDVRVIAATNRDLRSEVDAGRFREDLLFRLDVVPIHMPALRERKEDIPALVAHMLDILRRRKGLAVPHVLPEAMKALAAYDWPGNVRELRNIVERLAILAPGAEVGEAEVGEALPTRGTEPSPHTGLPGVDGVDGDPREEPPLRERLEAYEELLIESALDVADGNVAEAARALRTDRANLYRRMKRLGMRE